MRSRSPEKWKRTLCAGAPERLTIPTKTVPTGLVRLPPAGPAIPVIATPQSAPKRRLTPAAMTPTKSDRGARGVAPPREILTPKGAREESWRS